MVSPLAVHAQGLPLAINPAEQAYTRQQEFTSPITGEKFTATVLARGVGYGIRDFDGCPHPPINALTYALVIDPKSGYVAYPEDFARPTLWTAAELAEVLGAPRFARSAPEDAPWAGAFGWEKFENAAKLAEGDKARAASVANWWLQAAWAVRLDLLPAQTDFAAELERALRVLPPPQRDPADVLTPAALQLANGWARHILGDGQARGEAVNAAVARPPAPPSIREDAVVGVEPPPIAGGPLELDAEALLAVAWAYRSRGELVAARYWLGRAVQQEAEIKSTPLYEYLDNSISLEREYLARTQRWLRQAYEAGELRESQRGAAAFNLGEIARRLGDREGALYWYGEAAGRNLGAVNPRLLERQRRLVADDSNYA